MHSTDNSHLTVFSPFYKMIERANEDYFNKPIARQAPPIFPEQVAALPKDLRLMIAQMAHQGWCERYDKLALVMFPTIGDWVRKVNLEVTIDHERRQTYVNVHDGKPTRRFDTPTLQDGFNVLQKAGFPGTIQDFQDILSNVHCEHNCMCYEKTIEYNVKSLLSFACCNRIQHRTYIGNQ